MNHNTKYKILNLFDSNIEFIHFNESYDEKYLFESFCYLLKNTLSLNSILDIRTYFYEFEELDYSIEEVAFIISTLGIRFKKFNFILPLLKYTDIIKNFETDDREWIVDECNDCFGEGKIFAEETFAEENNSLIYCSQCNGTGQEEVYNSHYKCLTDKSIDDSKYIQEEFKETIQNVLDKTIDIILEKNLHPDIEEVYPAFKIYKTVKNF